MSNVPSRRRGDKVRWILLGCLGVLAVPCIVWMVAIKIRRPDASPLEVWDALVRPALALDLLGIIAAGVWLLHPPSPGAVGLLATWLGRFLAFVGVALSAAIVFGATCMLVGGL